MGTYWIPWQSHWLMVQRMFYLSMRTWPMCYFNPILTRAIRLHDLVLEITCYSIIKHPISLESQSKLYCKPHSNFCKHRVLNTSLPGQENIALQWEGRKPGLELGKLTLLLILLLTSCMSFEKHFSQIICLLNISISTSMKLKSDRNLSLNFIHT